MNSKLFGKKLKVLVTHPEVPKVALDLLRDKCEVIVCDNVPTNRSEILSKSKGVHAILWADHQPLNAEALDAAGHQLKAISTMSAGVDYVDIPEVKKRRIPLGHTPDVLNAAVADVAIGLMVAAARRFHEGRQKIETSTWETFHLQWMLGQEIRDATVGFLGFGGIAQAIASRLNGFDVGQIIYNTRRKSPVEEEFKAKHVKFDELLQQSDILFVACPLNKDSKEIFNEAAFNKMKPNCVFINIGRGGIVDQNALYNALKANKIFSAGLDVTVPEPLPATDLLMTLPNCVIIPHLGSATLRTRSDMATIAAHNILNGLAGLPMFAPVYEL